MEKVQAINQSGFLKQRQKRWRVKWMRMRKMELELEREIRNEGKLEKDRKSRTGVPNLLGLNTPIFPLSFDPAYSNLHGLWYHIEQRSI